MHQNFVHAKRLCVYIIKIFTHVIKTFHYWFHRGRASQTALTSALKIERKVVFHNSMILELRKVFILNGLPVWKWINFLVAISLSEDRGCGAKHLSLSMLQKEMIILKYHESPILVVVHVSCDFKVCSLAFISWFINLYVPVVNVDLTKPLAKYAGKIALFCCLSTLRCWFSLFSNSLTFLGPATHSILKQYAHSIHLLNI